MGGITLSLCKCKYTNIILNNKNSVILSKAKNLT